MENKNYKKDKSEVNLSQFKFRIKVRSRDSNGRVETVKVSENGLSEANKIEGFKIYILGFKEKVIYVGYTEQKLGNRFRGRFVAIGRNGDHGYRWKELADKGEVKDISDDIDLFIYKVNNEQRAEAIEAEIVYFARRDYKWPEYQTEIHFHHDADKNKEIDTAERIYNQIIAILKKNFL